MGDQYVSGPSYMYAIDALSVNRKVQDWFEHVEFCVTKEKDGMMWLNVATHIYPPKYEKFMDKAVYQSYFQHNNPEKDLEPIVWSAKEALNEARKQEDIENGWVEPTEKPPPKDDGDDDDLFIIDTNHKYEIHHWENVVCNMIYNEADPQSSKVEI